MRAVLCPHSQALTSPAVQRKIHREPRLSSRMIGILIIAHGTLGESLIQCACHVLNKRPPRVQQLGVTAQDDPLFLLPQARALVKDLDDGGGVLILSDMYGGTPANIAAKLLVPGRVEGVAGVNLPMLIRTLTYRDRPLATLLTKAVSGGCEGVMRIAPLTLHNAATGS
jgi:mannose PTS system EIIA component